MDGYRVKLKYNDYVHIHKVLSQISSPNLIIQSIAEEKYDDLLARSGRENLEKISIR